MIREAVKSNEGGRLRQINQTVDTEINNFPDSHDRASLEALEFYKMLFPTTLTLRLDPFYTMETVPADIGICNGKSYSYRHIQRWFILMPYPLSYVRNDSSLHQA